jgi:hypothetical protein
MHADGRCSVVFIMCVNADAYHQYRRRFDPADVGQPGASIDYLHDDYQLRGFRKGAIVLTSSAYLHPNYGKLIREVGLYQSLGHPIEVFDVRDGVHKIRLDRGEFGRVSK